MSHQLGKLSTRSLADLHAGHRRAVELISRESP
jgi:hypothetical protein